MDSLHLSCSYCRLLCQVRISSLEFRLVPSCEFHCCCMFLSLIWWPRDSYPFSFAAFLIYSCFVVCKGGRGRPNGVQTRYHYKRSPAHAAHSAMGAQMARPAEKGLLCNCYYWPQHLPPHMVRTSFHLLEPRTQRLYYWYGIFFKVSSISGSTVLPLRGCSKEGGARWPRHISNSRIRLAH